MTNYSKIQQKKAGTWINKQQREEAEQLRKEYRKFMCYACYKVDLIRADKAIKLSKQRFYYCDKC